MVARKVSTPAYGDVTACVCRRKAWRRVKAEGWTTYYLTLVADGGLFLFMLCVCVPACHLHFRSTSLTGRQTITLLRLL
jgi:hypothetical protein